MGVPFLGLWLDAPPSLLVKRLIERLADVSDATPAVLDLQLQSGVGVVAWPRIDASAGAKTVEGVAERLVKELR